MVSSPEQNVGGIANALDEVTSLLSGSSEIAASAAVSIGSNLSALEQITAGTSSPAVRSARELLAKAGHELRRAIGSQALAIGSIAQYKESIGAGGAEDNTGCAADAGRHLSGYREARERSSRLTAGSLITIGGVTTEEPWRIDKSPIESYDATFKGVLPRGRKIKDLLPLTGGICVVDLMASTTAVRDLLTGREGVGYAMRLVDGRTEEEKAADNALGIRLLSKDITSRRALKELGDIMGGQRANVVMARPLGGALNLPKHVVFYRSLINDIWDLLAEGGTALLETPSPRYMRQIGIDLQRWGTELENSGVEVQRTSLMLRLTRTPDSPDKLPMPQLLSVKA
jgi:hypothetical protein